MISDTGGSALPRLMLNLSECFGKHIQSAHFCHGLIAASGGFSQGCDEKPIHAALLGPIVRAQTQALLA